MSTPLFQLGLDDDADERSVKRAYARRLREVRPDVDPAGFQHLNELYHHALEWVRQRDAYAPAEPVVSYAFTPIRFDEVAAEASSPPLEPAQPAVSFAPPDAPTVQVAWTPPRATDTGIPHEAPPVDVRWDTVSDHPAPQATPTEHVADARSAFDFDAFFDTLVRQAALGDADAVRDWLHRQPPLWSLTTKAEAAQTLMPALYRYAPPLPDRCLDAILAFFDLDHVLSGQNALQLNLLRRRLHVEWLLRQPDRRELRIELRHAQPPVNTEPATLFAMLSGPFRWFAVLWKALPPYQPSEMANFLRWLEQAKVQSLPPAFDRRRIAFWRRAGDRSRVSLSRVTVVAARFAAAMLLATLIDVGLFLSGGVAPLMTLLLAYGCVGCVAYYTWMGLVQWQDRGQADDAPGPAAWWRLGFIPLLAIAAVALRRLVPLAVREDLWPLVMIVSAGMAAAAAVLAFVRYRHRSGAGAFDWFGRFVGWRLIFLVPLVKLLVLAGVGISRYAEIGAAIALGFWLADLWRQRAHLRASLARAPGG
ncbi:hypothetical protein [Dokdonella sp.]|uniref:hypothetical protein n=1 Tax=Dokdonella sp. TaxID=2291710 RepID=UPI001B2B6E86|nr:hypothetical protein [Dokdonella sp.]MBO9663443.1 hypothetical protein [Dokdonella sp.]